LPTHLATDIKLHAFHAGVELDASPKLCMDAYLAAFAITANLSLVTFDAGFRQFEQAGLKRPLLSAT
jgi:predicted nucleic acid-binding protein